MIKRHILNKETMEGLTEDILVKKATRGDVCSFEFLLKKYKNYLYKIAYSYTKNENDSLDLIQECSYKAWLNIKKLKNHSSFKVWISRILINIALDEYYKNLKKNNLEIDYTISIYEDAKLDIAEKLDLQNAIDLLKPEYKTVIILKYFVDISINNISEIMDLPPNTVKTYLRRAKLCIKNILKEEYLDEI